MVPPLEQGFGQSGLTSGLAWDNLIPSRNTGNESSFLNTCVSSFSERNHSSPIGGHFAGKKMYGSLVRHWWWDGMYADTLRYARAYPQCTIVSGGGKPSRPPLHPIPVRRLFQTVGVDIMELPCTDQGNRYVLVFQDFLSKWPLTTISSNYAMYHDETTSKFI